MSFFQAVTAARLRPATGGIVTTDLVLHYDPNAPSGYASTTVYDLVGSDDLTLYNGASVALPWMEFDGVNDIGYITANYAPSAVKFNWNSAFTFCAWLRPDFSASAGFSCAVGIFEDLGDFAGCGWHSGGTAGARLNLMFRMRENNTDSEAVTLDTAIGATDTAYMAVTYNGTRLSGNPWVVYRDGASVSATGTTSGSDTGTLDYTGATFSVGARESPAVAWYGGVGAVHIYDRVLSASEILQNYNATKSDYGL